MQIGNQNSRLTSTSATPELTEGTTRALAVSIPVFGRGRRTATTDPSEFHKENHKHSADEDLDRNEVSCSDCMRRLMIDLLTASSAAGTLSCSDLLLLLSSDCEIHQYFRRPACV